jgi:hypothetical protein
MAKIVLNPREYESLKDSTWFQHAMDLNFEIIIMPTTKAYGYVSELELSESVKFSKEEACSTESDEPRSFQKLLRILESYDHLIPIFLAVSVGILTAVAAEIYDRRLIALIGLTFFFLAFSLIGAVLYRYFND